MRALSRINADPAKIRRTSWKEYAVRFLFGGVVSTPHGDGADFAGIFAADTTGVFVGTLPAT